MRMPGHAKREPGPRETNVLYPWIPAFAGKAM